MIRRALGGYNKLFNSYTELRLQENRNTLIGLVKGSLIKNEKTSTSGVSARVYQNGSWGFASNPNISDDSIRTVINTASSNARFLDAKQNKGRGELPERQIRHEVDYTTKKNRISSSYIMEFLKEIDAYISNKYSDLANRSVYYTAQEFEKSIINSDGTEAYSLYPRSHIYVALTTENDGKPVDNSLMFGGLGNFEDWFLSPESLYKKIDDTYVKLMHKKEAVYAEAGKKECILSPMMAGMLVHEAIGHTTEADLVLMGSIAAHYLEQQVASPLVNMVDFAHTAFGELCPMPVHFDDEGVEAIDASIIENGILKGYMHNKETAKHFGVVPTGNARAFGFSDEPLVRMRNTVLLPGKDKLEDMIASIEDGYYLIKSSNGEADSTSEFTFSVSLGYEIKNGKLGRAIKDTTVSGIAFDMLKTVTMLSDKLEWDVAGYCGKKQMMVTAMGGPALKCELSIGGR